MSEIDDQLDGAFEALDHAAVALSIALGRMNRERVSDPREVALTHIYNSVNAAMSALDEVRDPD